MRRRSRRCSLPMFPTLTISDSLAHSFPAADISLMQLIETSIPAVKVLEGNAIRKMKDVKVARKVSVQGYGHTYDDMFVRSITLLPQARR